MKYCIIAHPGREYLVPVINRVVSVLSGEEKTVCMGQAAAKLTGFPDPELSDYVHIFTNEELAIEASDIIIAIGGDGTMLHAARLIHDSGKPLLGINSGRLGFLADIRMEELEDALSMLIAGKYEMESRFFLEATVDGKKQYALNEVLFSKHSSVSMITLAVSCDGIPVNKYWADGLIIATPTGSTAYNLSSGGPIILPETNVMVLTPVCPHALTTRPLVLPADKKITIVADPPEQQILLSNDGKVCDINTDKLHVEITRSEFSINLIKLHGRNYFHTLRAKLMWGLDLRE